MQTVERFTDTYLTDRQGEPWIITEYEGETHPPQGDPSPELVVLATEHAQRYAEESGEMDLFIADSDEVLFRMRDSPRENVRGVPDPVNRSHEIRVSSTETPRHRFTAATPVNDLFCTYLRDEVVHEDVDCDPERVSDLSTAEPGSTEEIFEMVERRRHEERVADHLGQLGYRTALARGIRQAVEEVEDYDATHGTSVAETVTDVLTGEHDGERFGPVGSSAYMQGRIRRRNSQDDLDTLQRRGEEFSIFDAPLFKDGSWREEAETAAYRERGGETARQIWGAVVYVALMPRHHI